MQTKVRVNFVFFSLVSWLIAYLKIYVYFNVSVIKIKNTFIFNMNIYDLTVTFQGFELQTKN